MGKAERTRQLHARERIAAQQAAARRAETRRRALIVGGSTLVVLAIVAGLVIFKLLQKPAPPAHPSAAKSLAAVERQITSVPASVLDAVGAGPTGASAVTPLRPISGAPLTSGGKPEMLYVGAEYCPYCAAERWAMAVALSRFGTLSGVTFIRSDSNDVFSNTSTLTFYKSSYTSKYLTFVPVETTTVTKQPLQSPTAAQSALLNTYGGGSFPFIDVGGKYIVSGASYLPSVLGSLPQVSPTHFGLTWQQIAADMQNPSSPVAQAILGTANHITAAICKATNGQPGSVCTSKAVTAVGGSI